MTHSVLLFILQRVSLLQAASVSARDAWSLPQDTVQSPGQPQVVGGALRFAVEAASVTWPSPQPWSTLDYTGQADYTSCHTVPLVWLLIPSPMNPYASCSKVIDGDLGCHCHVHS